MTDLEFLERLRRELSTSPAWNDVGRVMTSAADPDLTENELRVFEIPDDPATITVSVFRVIVEWEVGDARDAAPVLDPASQFDTPQPDEEPDGTIT